MYKTNMENEKNNVTSRYAETYTTIIAKRSTASQRHYNKFRAGLALIPLSRRCPGGSGQLRTVPHGF